MFVNHLIDDKIKSDAKLPLVKFSQNTLLLGLFTDKIPKSSDIKNKTFMLILFYIDLTDLIEETESVTNHPI